LPKPRNTRDENEALTRGETPPQWEKQSAKNRQKDKDARWTKKHGKSFFGYKNLATGKALERGMSMT
jgi:IS5 family transposase